jgi:SAM-dependent methyltransferase
MNKKQQTVESYNNNAKGFSTKFDALSSRVSDIEEAFALVGKDNPNVLEIGCGNGRDAKEILKRTNNYLGIDISSGLILLAEQKVPDARFEVADIENFQLPSDLDIVFAFASLIHIPKESLQDVFGRVFIALDKRGVFRISFKSADKYKEVTKEDEFGLRTYYSYTKSDIEELAKDFLVVKNETVNLREQEWLEVLVQKS